MERIHSRAVAIRQASMRDGETVLEDGNVSTPGPAIALSKTHHTQRDTGMRDLPDEEIARRARDRSLPGETRRKYQTEEKLRGQRNKQKRKSIYNNAETMPSPTPSIEIFVPAPTASDDGFFETAATVVIIALGIAYFLISGDPSVVERAFS